MPGRNTDIRKLRHGKEPVFDHRLFLNQPVRTDSPVSFPSATIPNITMNQEIGSSDFSPNIYGGGGTKWWKDHLHKWNFTTDKLVVRGTMWIWELLINQLRASNGTIIISSAAKVTDFGVSSNGGVSWDLIFESPSTTANTQPFAVNDIIIAKRFTMPNDGSAPSTLKESVCTVTAISIGGDFSRITVNADAGYSDPENGMEFVRIGNTTDTSRQGSIVLTSDGIDSGDNPTVPYIDVYDGIDSRTKFLNKDYVKARLGRLDELTGNVNEFGLWTNNLYLQASPNNTMPVANIYSDTTPPDPWYEEGTTWYDTDDHLFYKWSQYSTTITSGSLIVGQWYHITDFNIGDDFTNVGAPGDKTDGTLPATFNYIITDNSGGADFTGVGAANNNVGTIFTVSGAAGTWALPTWGTGAVQSHDLQVFQATGTTPTDWTNGSTLKVSGWVLEGAWRDSSGAFFNAEAPSGAGFYAGATHLGFYDGSQWATYMDSDGDFFLKGAGSGDGLTWDHSTNTLNITGSINLTNQIDASDISDVDSYATDQDRRTLNEMLSGQPDSPAGTGFFANADNLGFYKDGDWRGYWLNSGANSGDFFLKGASNTALWWDYSAAALFIGGTTAGSAYLKAIAGTARLQFYDDNNVNVMNLGSDLIGSHGGIELKNKGLFYMSITNNDAISNIHLEKYNQSSAGVQGLQTLYLSNNASANVTANPTNAWVVSKIAGERNSANDIYGTYSRVNSFSTGKAYGFYSVMPGNSTKYGFYSHVTGSGTSYGYYASVTPAGGTAAYGIYSRASGATTNWAGYFQDGNVRIENNLDVDGTVDGVNIATIIGGVTEAEMNQIENIGTKTISNTQWGFLGALDQGLTKASDVQFNKIYPGNQVTAFLDYSSGGTRFVFNRKVEASSFNTTTDYQQAGNVGITSVGFVIAVGDTITVRGGIITSLSH